MEQFLRATEVIDWTHPAVLSKAKELAEGAADTHEIIGFPWGFVTNGSAWMTPAQPIVCTVSTLFTCPNLAGIE